ncbi:MAG: cytochrome c biogenesis CcdA family protein [Clostridia bacterium]|nr:cytochrome c biogenesis CcdA family protein [Clostridia bacterium]
MNTFTLVLTFVEGILTFISPCILPLLPVYFFYLAGISSGEEREEGVRNNVLAINSIGFVLGFTVVFVALGAAATSFGHFLKGHSELLRVTSGIIMMVFGANFLLMGILKRSFLNFEKRFEYKFNRLKFANSIVFGIVFGFGWTPCLGAFLGSALALAANAATVFQGITLLLAYSVGLGIPFILFSILFERLKQQLKEIQKHGRIINIISGIVLLAAGILVCADKVKYLGSLTWW